MLLCWVWYFAVLAVRFIPGVDRHTSLYMTFALATSVVVTIAMSALSQGKPVVLRVFPDRIVIGPRTLERRSLSCEFATWKEPYAHTTQGTALCLRDAHGTFCLGGRDRLSSSSNGDPPIERVDASMAREHFDALLKALSLHEPAAASQSHGLAIDLLPCTLSLRGQFRVMSPWLATIAFVCSIGLAASVFHLERSQTAMVVVEGLTIVAVLGGLALTIIGSRKPPAASRYRLLIQSGKVLLEDTRRAPGRVRTIGPPLRAERRFYRSSGRGGNYDYPTVRILWPSGREDVVGLMSTTFHWPDRVRRLRKLEYLIGNAEWQRLIATLPFTE